MRHRKPLGVAALVGAILAAVFVATPAIGGPSLAKLAKQVKNLNNRVTELSKQPGPQGPAGPQGPQGPQGPSGSLTGSAGGALTGSYPNPSLNVSGGPCPNGQELVDVSALAALTCSAGVYSDGSNNVAAGPTSFPALTIGTGNSALGSGALGSLTEGGGNVALGRQALLSNTSGSQNAAVGLLALSSNTIADSNSALGTIALANNTGTGNLALGSSAGSNLTTGNNNIDIDNSGVAGESGTIRIGDSQTRAFMAGVRGVTTGNADAVQVLIDSAGQLGTVSSSRRVKRDIRPLDALEPLMKLRPVSFRYRSGPPELHYGLIAEQVARVLPTLAVRGSDGLPETVQYQELPALLLAKIQDQQRQINRQHAQIRWLMREAHGR